VTSLLVVKPLAGKMQPKTMVRWFLGVSAIAVLGIATASEAWQLYPCIFLFVTSMGFVLPGLVTTISNYGDSSRQGETLGIISSIQALMTVIVMMAGGSLFALHRNLTVVGGAGLLIASWIMFATYFSERRAVVPVGVGK
jgi:DHA1 family tetracycline resistance protein-like MFS transporter